MIAETVDDRINKWIREFSDDFYDHICHRIPDKNTARDILQETFIAAWINRDSFRQDSSEKTWLRAILNNKISDYYRVSRKFTEVKINDQFFDNNDHWTEQAAPNDWPDALDEINKKEFYIVLNQCTHKLNRLQQAAFTMKYMDGINAAEICKVLEVNASNYWVLIHRSKLQLRQCLEKNWFQQNI